MSYETTARRIIHQPYYLLEETVSRGIYGPPIYILYFFPSPSSQPPDFCPQYFLVLGASLDVPLDHTHIYTRVIPPRGPQRRAGVPWGGGGDIEVLHSFGEMRIYPPQSAWVWAIQSMHARPPSFYFLHCTGQKARGRGLNDAVYP